MANTSQNDRLRGTSDRMWLTGVPRSWTSAAARMASEMRLLAMPVHRRPSAGNEPAIRPVAGGWNESEGANAVLSAIGAVMIDPSYLRTLPGYDAAERRPPQSFPSRLFTSPARPTTRASLAGGA